MLDSGYFKDEPRSVVKSGRKKVVKSQLKKDFWEELDKLLTYRQNGCTEPPGPEWFNIDQFAKRYELKRDAATRRLYRLFVLGKLEKKIFQINFDIPRNRIYYKLK